MDRTPAGLEPNSCADGSLFCGQNARVAENCPPVKGKMHGGFTAALDMRPVSRLYCGQGVGDATPGIIHILPCFAPRYRLYTKYGIDPSLLLLRDNSLPYLLILFTSNIGIYYLCLSCSFQFFVSVPWRSRASSTGQRNRSALTIPTFC